MLDFLRFSSKNLYRKKSRSWLTILSIAVGICSVLLISVIGETGKAAINQEIDSFGIGGLTLSASSLLSLPLGEEEQALIDSLPEVESTQPILLSYSPASARGLQTQAAVWGIGAGKNQTIGLELLHGRLLTSSDITQEKNLCLMDEVFAKALFQRENAVGKTVELTIGEHSCPVEIAGVVRSGGAITQNLLGGYLPYFVYLPYTTLQTMLGDPGYSALAIEVSQPGTEEQTGARILRLLRENTGVEEGYQIENVAKQKEQFDGILSIITAILTGCAGISLLVAGLGIMTTMLSSVGERTREIGIKKAIGASFQNILWEFLWEALLISLAGSLLGCAVAGIICILGYFFWHIGVIIEPESILFCVGFSLILGGISGVYPACKAAGLPPAQALRSQ